jgi:hypothetical protein
VGRGGQSVQERKAAFFRSSLISNTLDLFVDLDGLDEAGNDINLTKPLATPVVTFRCYGERLRSGLGLVVVVAVLRRRCNHLAGRRINEMDSPARCTSH